MKMIRSRRWADLKRMVKMERKIWDLMIMEMNTVKKWRSNLRLRKIKEARKRKIRMLQSLLQLMTLQSFLTRLQIQVVEKRKCMLQNVNLLNLNQLREDFTNRHIHQKVLST